MANIEPRKNQRLLAAVARQMELDLVLLGQARDPDVSRTTAWRPAERACGTWATSIMPIRCSNRPIGPAEVFVLPSLLETPGLAALEAAAQGAKLVVTERRLARDEYFQDLASYVDPDDARACDAASSAAWPPRPTNVCARTCWPISPGPRPAKRWSMRTSARCWPPSSVR